MKQLFTILAFLLICFAGHTQPGDSIIRSSWKLEGEYSIGDNEAWSSDILGNVYLTDRKVIRKYDSTGVQKFSQSVKSFGKVAEIRPVNTMKLVLFSEDQQILCWMDNTLTLGEECIDLSKYGMGLAVHIAASGQPEKLWVVDQLNSELLLLDLSRTNQSQQIRNLKGILNMSEIKAISEVNNELFLLDNKGVIYRFDLYGSLISTYEFAQVSGFAVKDDALLVLTSDDLIVQHLKDDHKMSFKLPLAGIEEFRVSGSFFYFRVKNKILKYSPVFQ